MGTERRRMYGASLNQETENALRKKYPNHNRHNSVRALLGLPALEGRKTFYRIEDMKVNEQRVFSYDESNPSSLYHKIKVYEKTTPIRFRLSGNAKGYVVTRYK